MTRVNKTLLEESPVYGPSSSTNETVAIFDGTTGKLVKDSGILIADIGDGDVVGPSSSTTNRYARYADTTGKVLIDGPNGIPNADLATVSEATIKGRPRGSGSGTPLDMTPEQVSKVLDLDIPNLCGNPGMQVWQVTKTAITLVHRDPLAVGFLFGTDGGTSVFYGLQSSPPPLGTGPYSIEIGCTTAQAVVPATAERHIRYVVYGHKLYPYRNKDIKVKFWVFSAKTGIHSLAALNEARDRTYVAEYIVNVENTWELKEVTIPFASRTGTWNFGDGYGLGLRWSIVGGSNYQTTPDVWAEGNYSSSPSQVNLGDTVGNRFLLSDVQIYPADHSPMLILPDYEKVYQESLRQYRVITTNVSGANINMGLCPSATSVNFDMPLGIEMYAPPKITYRGTINTDVVVYSATAFLTGFDGFTSFERSRDMMKVTLSRSSGGLSVGALHFLRLETTLGKIIADGHLA